MAGHEKHESRRVVAVKRPRRSTEDEGMSSRFWIRLERFDYGCFWKSKVVLVLASLFSKTT
jgi:hypothetical protein